MFGAIMIKIQKCSCSLATNTSYEKSFTHGKQREKVLLICAIHKHIQNITTKQPLIYPLLFKTTLHKRKDIPQQFWKC